MRRIFNILIGVLAAYTLVNKAMSCPECGENIFGFPVPGYAYLAIWAFVLFSCVKQESAFWSGGKPNF